MSKRSDPYNQRDRSPKERYVAMSHNMVDSEAFRCLGGAAWGLLILIRRRYNGYNNGKIAVGVNDAARWLYTRPAAIVAAFAELEEHGLIQCVRKGRPGGRGTSRQASEWALTDRQLDVRLPQGFEHRVGAWRHWQRPATPRKTPPKIRGKATTSEALRGVNASGVVALTPHKATASEAEKPQNGSHKATASEAHIYTRGWTPNGGALYLFARSGRLDPDDRPPRAPSRSKTKADIQPPIEVPPEVAGYRGGTMSVAMRSWATAARAAAGMSKSAMARTIGVSLSQIINVEAGKAGFSPKAAARYLAAIGAAPQSQLILQEGRPPKSGVQAEKNRHDRAARVAVVALRGIGRMGPPTEDEQALADEAVAKYGIKVCHIEWAYSRRAHLTFEEVLDLACQRATGARA